VKRRSKEDEGSKGLWRKNLLRVETPLAYLDLMDPHALGYYMLACI